MDFSHNYCMPSYHLLRVPHADMYIYIFKCLPQIRWARPVLEWDFARDQLRRGMHYSSSAPQSSAPHQVITKLNCWRCREVNGVEVNKWTSCGHWPQIGFSVENVWIWFNRRGRYTKRHQLQSHSKLEFKNRQNVDLHCLYITLYFCFIFFVTLFHKIPFCFLLHLKQK